MRSWPPSGTEESFVNSLLSAPFLLSTLDAGVSGLKRD